ncbi:MAG: carbonic anhydrase [Methylophaga sp.]|nr:MAG: carbonic anhydrase [Methylophaga sp.]
MKKLLIFAATLSFTGSVYAAENSHWGYSGHQGPDNWASLTADNFACSGKNQSPVNLTGFIEADLEPIMFNYQPGGHEVINNGHTIQVNYEKGSSINLTGKTFNLLQVHFHAPSENHINGQSYPLEAHLVHADEQGNLAVVAVMFEQGVPNKGLEVQTDKYGSRQVIAVASANKWLKNIWSVMPSKAGETQKLLTMVNVADILPTNQDYYRFNGSLTTPPCSEGVQWLVMKKVMTVQQQQIDPFVEVLHEPNNRPLQPINSRTILQ